MKKKFIYNAEKMDLILLTIKSYLGKYYFFKSLWTFSFALDHAHP